MILLTKFGKEICKNKSIQKVLRLEKSGEIELQEAGSTIRTLRRCTFRKLGNCLRGLNMVMQR